MLLSSVQFNSVQSLSCVQLFPTPWIAARQASLSNTNSWRSPTLMSIGLVMPSSHLILCHLLLLLPPIPPRIRVFPSPGFSPTGKLRGLSSFLSQHLAWPMGGFLILVYLWLFLNALCSLPPPPNPHPSSTQGFINTWSSLCFPLIPLSLAP